MHSFQEKELHIIAIGSNLQMSKPMEIKNLEHPPDAPLHSVATSGAHDVYPLNTHPRPPNSSAPACADDLASCTAPSSASGASSCSLVSGNLSSWLIRSEYAVSQSFLNLITPINKKEMIYIPFLYQSKYISQMS